MSFPFTSHFLTAADYESMFKPLLALAPKQEPKVKREIEWAKSALKKQNRILWWLRWVRFALANADLVELMASPNEVQETPAYKQQLDALRNYADQLTREATAKGASHLEEVQERGLASMHQWLEHFFTLSDAAIQAMEPGYMAPSQLHRELRRMEQDFVERNKQSLAPRPEDSIFLDCGSGWAWWLLPRASCTEEGDAMGHCGNAPDADRTDMSILSLRKKKALGNETRWEPHVTFILHQSSGVDTGTLGEMKGRGNEKPVAKYHPFIVRLLEDERIEGIDGGGYKAENNFSVDDLSPEDVERVEEANPKALMSLEDYHDTYGMDDSCVARIAAITGLKKDTYDEGFVINRFNDIFEECGNEAAINLNLYLHKDRMKIFAESLVEEINPPDAEIYARIAEVILVEFPEAKVSKELDDAHKTVVDWLLKAVVEEGSELRTILEESLFGAVGVRYRGSKTGRIDRDELQDMLWDAESSSCEDGTAIGYDGRGAVQYFDFESALHYATRGNSAPHFGDPSIWIDFDLDKDAAYAILDKALPLLGDGRPSVRALEQKGQERLFNRPATDEEAQQNGIKHSRFQAAFLAHKTASDYEAMFKPFQALVAEDEVWALTLPAKIKSEIQWAKNTLKKQNRIIWWLRWVRLAMISKTLEQERVKLDALAKYQKKLMAEMHTAQSVSSAALTRLKPELEHFYSLNVPDIQNGEPGLLTPEDLIDKFKIAESDMIAKAKGTLQPKPEDDIYIDCGGGWAWWFLPRASCPEEGVAMGHCGNSPESRRKDRTLLSLRHLRYIGKEERWEPHVTCILHTDGNIQDHGVLGEMKGKGNAKPVERYHPAIMQLLEDVRITGIVGGGYLAKNNFSFTDLTRAQQSEVRKANPEATFTWDEYTEKHDIDMSAVAETLDLEDSDKEDIGGSEGDAFVLDRWSDIASFVENNGDDDSQRVAACADGPMHFLAENLLAKVAEDKNIFAGIARQINREFAGANTLDPESETIVQDVIAAVSSLDDEGESVLRTGLEQALLAGMGYTSPAKHSFRSLVENALDDAMDDNGDGFPCDLMTLRNGDIIKYISEKAAWELVQEHKDDLGHLGHLEWQYPYVSIISDISNSQLEEPDEALNWLGDAFTQNYISPKKLEERGQGRLFNRPESNEEAEREGIKHSSFKSAFLCGGAA